MNSIEMAARILRQYNDATNTIETLTRRRFTAGRHEQVCQALEVFCCSDATEVFEAASIGVDVAEVSTRLYDKMHAQIENWQKHHAKIDGLFA